tara:strand:+ start:549 stop:887 length:339 start_codon:yes stop_codon:yes gene_type:complete
MTTEQPVLLEGWQGGEGAYIAFGALVRANKQPGLDFDYHPRGQGPSVDFVFNDPPGLALQVEEQGSQIPAVLLKAQLAGVGRTLVILKYNLLTQDPDWLIEEALQYRDHSRG